MARAVLQRRVHRAQQDPAIVAQARRQMERLLAAVGRSDEVNAAALAYIAHQMTCDELRWHPRQITNQRVVGTENLREAYRVGKGVVLSFAHHAHYVGTFASVARDGIPVKVLAATSSSRNPGFIQHLLVARMGGGLLPVSRGTAGIVDELRHGSVVAVASDVPGGSVVEFAGRSVRCSSGAVHAALQAQAPVVILTSHRDADGLFVRLARPIFPGPETTAPQLLADIVRRHEAAIMEWPEVAENPLFAWAPADENRSDR